MGAFIDGEWESICKLFTVEESPDLFLEYYSPSSFSNESCGLISSVNNENSYSSLSGWISNPPNMFLETTNHTNSNSNNYDAEKFLPDFLSCIDFTNMNEENDASLGVSIAHETLNNSPTLKRNHEEETNSVEPAKKNARISKVVRKGKRKAGSKIDGVNQDLITKESNNLDSNSDDSNICSASEEMNETEDSNSNSNTTVSLTSTGKKRASRGAATDPQSLYARKRRMRINERLRILQSLVPNGTKVDISTMLEEAFHYVKFLQLQIGMLSSDELWMYAPLAYNGIDIGAYRRMPHPFLGL